jgi:hypothetical protein
LIARRRDAPHDVARGRRPDRAIDLEHDGGAGLRGAIRRRGRGGGW